MFADTLTSNVAVVLVEASAGNDAAGLGIVVVGFSGETLGAATLHQVVSLGAQAVSGSKVIYLVGSALNSAGQRINIVELTFWALGAVIVDKVVSWLAYASSSHPILIDCANRSTNSIATLSTYLLVSVNTVAALQFLIVNLS